MIQLIHGDCLEEMKKIPDGSVDMVLTDPPYGTMKGINEVYVGYGRKNHDGHGWDSTIEHEAMLVECNRVLRTNGALLLFSQEPYTSKLVTETHGNLPFSYRLTWLKNDFANALLVNKAPVNYTEDICVFFKKYDTQGKHPLRDYVYKVFKHIGKTKNEIFKEMGHQGACHFMRHETMQFGLCTNKTYNELVSIYGIDKIDGFMSFDAIKDIDQQFKELVNRTFNLTEGKKYKSNVLEYKKDYTGHHPTQKPVLLMEDLIKTYTNEGETVLDFTMGSGTTGVACRNLNRNFIGIELDEEYYKIAKARIL